MRISDDQFDEMLVAHFEKPSAFDEGAEFAERTMRKIRHAVWKRMLIRAVSLGLAILIGAFVAPWGDVWASLEGVPVNMTMLVLATPVALAAQFWSYLKFQD